MPDAPPPDDGDADPTPGDEVDLGPVPPQSGPPQSGPPQSVPLQWDDDDPRRRLDSMAPPTEPCECYCIECGRKFSSEAIWFQRVVNDPDGDPDGEADGFWMCPTPNCGGAGFTFDLFPVDPDHPANAGWIHDEPEDGIEDGIEWEDVGEDAGEDEGAGGGEYDPSEPFYAALDAEAADEGDFEGEEWKHGQSPDDWLSAGATDDGGAGVAWADDPRGADDPLGADGADDDGPVSSSAGPHDPSGDSWREAQERRYDEPDERPREVDWSDMPGSRRPSAAGGGDDGEEDDLPF